MTEHTPGPWLSTVSGQFVRKIDISGKWPDWNICKVNLNASADNCATGRANARLIARAPDLAAQNEALLEALKSLLTDCEIYAREGGHRPEGFDNIVQARAAIAAAEKGER